MWETRQLNSLRDSRAKSLSFHSQCLHWLGSGARGETFFSFPRPSIWVALESMSALKASAVVDLLLFTPLVNCPREERRFRDMSFSVSISLFHSYSIVCEREKCQMWECHSRLQCERVGKLVAPTIVVRAHTLTYRVLSKKEEEKRSREMGNTLQECPSASLSLSLSLSVESWIGAIKSLNGDLSPVRLVWRPLYWNREWRTFTHGVHVLSLVPDYLRQTQLRGSPWIIISGFRLCAYPFLGIARWIWGRLMMPRGR